MSFVLVMNTHVLVGRRNSRFQRDSRPIEEGCDCYACKTFCRGAIRHFFFAGEMLGPLLVSVHNIRFYQRLMADIRRAIGEGTFERFRQSDPRCALGPAVAGAPASPSVAEATVDVTGDGPPGGHAGLDE